MPRVPKPTFADRLAEACRYHPEAPADYGRQAWIRRELAKLGSPISSTAISNWFAGYTQPQPDLAMKLAKILRRDLAWLRGEETGSEGEVRGTINNAGNQIDSANKAATIDIPVPVRPGLIVRVVGVPEDITAQEACRIANVIRALAPTSE